MARPVPAESALGVRDVRVDWLRGAAALMVLLHHALAIPDPVPLTVNTWLRTVTQWGYLGVPIFFVLSGRCVGRAWLRDSAVRTFAWRRWRRIYPPYLASLGLCVLVILLRKFTSGINDLAPVPNSFAAAMATLTLATDPVTRVPVMNWVYWSLSYEIAFYALLAALLFWGPLARRLRAWLVLHGCLCLMDALHLGHDRTPLFFLQYWGLFAVGVGLCLHFAKRPEARLSLAISAAHALVLVVLGRFGAAHVVGGLTVVALLAPIRWWQPAADAWVTRVGIFSYSLYLIHIPVAIYLVQGQLRPLLPLTSAGALTMLVLTVGAAVAAALLFYRTIERRFTRSPSVPYVTAASAP